MTEIWGKHSFGILEFLNYTIHFCVKKSVVTPMVIFGIWTTTNAMGKIK